MPDDLNQPQIGTTDQPSEPVVPGTPPPPEPPPGPPPTQEPTKPTETPTEPTPPSQPPPEEPQLVISTPPKKSRVKVILAAIVGLLILASIPAAVYLVQQVQEIREKAVVSGKITVCGIELGPPTNEQPPSEANNGTYSVVVPIKNTSSDSKRVKMQTTSCVCNEGGGSPSGKCYGEDKCQNSTPFEVTIRPGETYNQTLSAQQPTGVPCGSFQVDLVTLEVNGDTSCSIPWGTPVWGLWLTKKNVEECLVAPPEGSISCQPSSICFPPGECGDNSTISWSTSNAPDVWVYVYQDGGGGTPMANNASGSTKPTWFCSGHYYDFKLYANGQSNLLGSCQVTINECTKPTPSPGVCSPEGGPCGYGIAGQPLGTCCPGLFCKTFPDGGICVSPVTPTPTSPPGTTPTPTPRPTPTPTLPPDTARCEFCRAYDEDWNEITNFSTITVGQTVYFATRGSTTHAQGITQARFRITINGVVGSWQETTSKHDNEFYIQYSIPSAGSYTVESMVYNPALGWY